MDPYHLNNEEVEYEYRLRNSDRQDYSQIRQVRAILSEQIKADIQPTNTIESLGLDPQTELNTCIKIARDLDSKINKSRVHIPRLRTKWEHLKGRISRINDPNLNNTEGYQEVLSVIDKLQPKLEGISISQEAPTTLEQLEERLYSYLEDSNMAFGSNGNSSNQGQKVVEEFNPNLQLNSDVPQQNTSMASNSESRVASTPSSGVRPRANRTLIQGPPTNTQAYRDWNPIASTQNSIPKGNMSATGNINRPANEVYRNISLANTNAIPNTNFDQNMGRASDLFGVEMPEGLNNRTRGINLRSNPDVTGVIGQQFGTNGGTPRNQPPNYDQSEEIYALRNQITAMQEQFRNLVAGLPTPRDEVMEPIGSLLRNRSQGIQHDVNLQSTCGARYNGTIPRDQTQCGNRSNSRPDPYQLRLDNLNLDSFEDDRHSVQSSEDEHRPFQRPIFNLAKSWQLKYSGDDKSMDLEQFLNLVEAHARTNGISHRVLFQNGLNFLQDPAREIYLAKMDELGNWEQYKNMLRGAFTAGNSQFNLREKIRSTIQGPKEPFATFLARMLNMMKGVTHPPMDEQEKVSIIKRNIRADLGSRLLTHEIQTLPRLEAMVMRVEKNIVEISGNYRATYGRTSANSNSNGTSYPQNRYSNKNQIYQVSEYEDQEWIEEDYPVDSPVEISNDTVDVNQVSNPRRDYGNRPQNPSTNQSRTGYGPNTSTPNNPIPSQGPSRQNNSVGYQRPSQPQNQDSNSGPRNSNISGQRRVFCWICMVEGHHTTKCEFNPRFVYDNTKAENPELVKSDTYNPVAHTYQNFRRALENKPPG